MRTALVTAATAGIGGALGAVRWCATATGRSAPDARDPVTVTIA